MKDIKNIYDMLEWKNSDAIRAEGFRMAREIEDFSLLIFPPAPAFVWECCAQIICEKTDAALEPYLSKLLEWIADLNWAGAPIICERLKKMSGKILKKPFVDCFNAAIGLNNDEGLHWVDYLSELLDNEELKTDLPENILFVLQQHYKNWGFWYDE